MTLKRRSPNQWVKLIWFFIEKKPTVYDFSLETDRHPPGIYLLGDNVSIIGTYLAGGGWTLYAGAKNNGHGGKGASNVAVKDTIFGREFFQKSGHFGAVTYWDRDQALGNVWSGNSYDDGRPVVP